MKRRSLRRQLYLWFGITLLLFAVFSLLHYFSSCMISYDRAISSAEQLMEQASSNVISILDDVQTSAIRLGSNVYVQELMVSQDRVRSLELYSYVSELTEAIKAANKFVYSITWINDEGRKISDPVRDESSVVGKLRDLYHLEDSAFRNPMLSSVVQDDLNNFFYFGYMFPVYSTKTTFYTKLGSGIFILDVEELGKTVSFSSVTENSVFAILDQDNRVVACNREWNTGEIWRETFWDAQTSEDNIFRAEILYHGVRVIAQSMPVRNTGWRIVSIIPVDDMMQDVQIVLQADLLITLFGAIALLAIVSGTIRSISRPVDAMVKFLKEAEKDDVKRRMAIPSVGEFAIIAENVNQMLDRADDMSARMLADREMLYESRLAEKNAELLALQSQINPHFLYNTLGCMSSIAIANDVPEVADMSVAMSYIYRYSIKGSKFVPLRDELKCIQEYMRIVKIRYLGRFDAEYRISDELLELYTLRMILQPLVENAVYHGMEQRRGCGRVCISAEIQEENVLMIQVQNDGKAMTVDELNAVQTMIRDYETSSLYGSSQRSIGLSNINQRIKIQFGTAYGLSIASDESFGTCVTLRLPVLQTNPDGTDNVPVLL